MKKYTICLCLLAAAVAPGLSLASPLTFSTTTPIPATTTDWAGTLAFPQFDPAMGTPVAVELKIDTTYGTLLIISNNADSESSGWAKTELILSVQDAGNHLVEPVLDLNTSQFDFTLAPGGQAASGMLEQTGSSDRVYTDPAVLAAFTGPGTITLNAVTQTFAIISYTGGNTDAVQSTCASATGTVTYTFLPEPATLSFLALGMVFLRRRAA